MSYDGAFYQTRTLVGGGAPTRHHSIEVVNDNGIVKICRNGYTLAIITPSGALIREIMWAHRPIRRELRGVRDALHSMGWCNAYQARVPWASLLRRTVYVDGARFHRWVKPT